MFLKKLFTKPKIQKEKLEMLKEIAAKFENQIFTENNYDFLYDELEKFNGLAINYVPTLIYFLQIAQQKRNLNRNVVEREEKINRNFCQSIFKDMNKVIDFILSKYEVKE